MQTYKHIYVYIYIQCIFDIFNICITLVKGTVSWSAGGSPFLVPIISWHHPWFGLSENMVP
jgi:hypothetical protein